MTFFKKYLPLIFLIFTSLLFAAIGKQATALFQYEHTLILQGEIWRLITGHLIHNDWKHLFLNIAGLIIIWILIGRYFGTIKWFIALAIASLFLSISFLIFLPELERYMGLSGLIHAVFIIGIVQGIKEGNKEVYIFLLIIVSKIIWEQMSSNTPLNTLDAVAIVDAHLYGALCGLFTALFLNSSFKPYSTNHKNTE